MSESTSDRSSWIERWIEQQRGQLQRFAATTAAADPVAGLAHELDERWLHVLNGWQNAWFAGTSADEGAPPDLSTLLAGLPPLGLAGEQTQVWRDLAAAGGECRRLQQELRDVLVQVQADTLAALEKAVREREASGLSIATHRELYDLWIECGERVYSGVAHSEAFCRLQGELGNATIRLRARRQALLEQGLKQFDLPTRSELNTVHRQMRELRARVAALEAQLADSNRSECK